ncbi:MAG: exonuclease domain-containing protein [Clostridia bacterium]|nr:exonuclease domain-containing protein [Clostridia bacterium]
MKYVVLDLEWNQTYFEKAQSVQKELSVRLRGEVIQIGAVMLNEAKDIVGSYRITVKPKFFKRIHKHVARLTGITQEQIDHGVPLTEAMDCFRRFTGDDAVFLTWGPDDLPMLYDNLRANRLDGSFLSRYYDMQPMFNRETDGERRQRSLEYAMEHFGIAQTLPAHDALNDAYFTALVAQKLNIAEGIRQAEYAARNEIRPVILGDADAGEEGFSSLKEVFAHPYFVSPVCPVCHTSLEGNEPVLHSKGQKYSVLFSCAEHGAWFRETRLYRNINETLRAKVTFAPATEETVRRYREKLVLQEEEKKNSVRRRRRAVKGEKKAEQNAGFTAATQPAPPSSEA